MLPLSEIHNPEQRIREIGFRAGTLPPEQARQMLLGSLADPYPPARHVAARLLGEHLDDVVQQTLLSLLAGEVVQGAPAPEAPVRHAAALALGGAEEAAAVEAGLAQATEDPEADVRYQALVTLFSIDASDEVLRGCAARGLDDSDDEVVIVAAQITAARQYAENFTGLVARRRRMRGVNRTHLALSLAEMIARDPGLATGELVEDLFTDLTDALRREETVAAASDALVTLAANPTFRVRVQQALRGLLGRWSLHPILRVQVAGALARLEDPEGAAYLKKSMTSRNKGAKGYTIELAGRIGLDEFYDEIERLAGSLDYHNETALLALQAYGTPRALATLEAAASSHPDPDARALARELTER